MQYENSHAASGKPPIDTSRHLIITVHGIRTFGQWQDRLASLIQKNEGIKIEVHKYHYGYFSVIAFWIPVIRRLATRRFLRALLAECTAQKWDRIDIVSHSFGTHMVAWALRSTKPEQRPRIHTLILAGSVLKTTFAWVELMPKYVKRVINECGNRDNILILSQLFVPFTGMAGRIGFIATMERPEFRNRYFNFGHSGYFRRPDNTPQDDFMLLHWIPILTTEWIAPNIDERDEGKSPTILGGVFQVILKNAEPLKLFGYATLLLAFICWLFIQWHTARVATNLANSRLAITDWQVAQDLRNTSAIKAAHFFLHSAEILSSTGNFNGCRDSELAGQFESTLVDRSWVQDAPVLGCVLSPDCSRIISWGYGGNIRVLDVNNPSSSSVLTNSDVVIGASFNRDGSKVLSWTADGTTRIWSLVNQSLVKTFKHHGAVNGAVFVSGDTRLLTWSSDDSAILWDVANQLPLKVFQHSNAPTTLQMSLGFIHAQLRQENEICAASFNHDESLVITAGSDATARLWSLTNVVPLFTLRSSGLIRGAEFSAQDDYVVCWGEGGLNWFPSHPKGSMYECHNLDSASVRGVQFDQEQKRILSWSEDGTINVYAFPSGHLLLSLHQDGSVNGTMFLDKGSNILSWSDSGAVVLWSAYNGKEVREYKQGSPVTGAALNADESLLLTYGDDVAARLWNLSDGRLLQTYQHQGLVNGANFVPKSTQILTWSEDGVIRLWNLETGGCFRQFKLHGKTQGASFLSDGSNIFTWNEDGTIAFWNTNSARPTCVFEHGQNFSGITATTTGNNIVSWGSDGTIKLWSAGRKSADRVFNEKGAIDGLITSENDEFLLEWNQGGSVIAWDINNGKEVNNFSLPGIAGASFAPKGRTFITWGSQGQVDVWQIGKSQRQRTRGHDDAVLGAEWKPDAKQFLTWSIDGTAKLWSIDNSEPIQTFSHANSVSKARFSQNGEYVLTWGLDNEAKLWRLGSEEPLRKIVFHEALLGAAFNTDGRSIWTWTADGTLQLWIGAEPPKIFQQGTPVQGFTIGGDGSHFLTWGADGCIRFWTTNHTEPIFILRDAGQVQKAELRPNRTEILTSSEDKGTTFWNFSVDDRISIEERVLEFDVRSATTLGPEGQVHVLRPDELEAKQLQLAKFRGLRLAP